jgi:uncharacterized protein
MDPIKILEKYFDKKSKTYKNLLVHSKLVLKKAIKSAKKITPLPDIKFIKEAVILHDIGISLLEKRKKTYICHGILGREILEKEGLPKHALVCERHIGVGISKKEIIKEKLPLPKREMRPKTTEEEIISYSDLFYSKRKPEKEKTILEIKKELAKFEKEKVKKFEEWHKKYR